MNLWKNRTWKPMLLKQMNEAFNSNDYLFEMKYDGIRAIVYASPERIIIISRNGKNITNLYPELQNLKRLVNRNIIFDGEIVAIDKNKPSFSKLQERSYIKDENIIISMSKSNPVIYVAFDLLYFGTDLTNIPLIERKNFLNEIKENDYFIKSFYIINKGKDLYNIIQKAKIEGIVAKKLFSVYEINKRSWSWIKIKCWQKGEFYIGGYQKNIKSKSISLFLGELKNKKLYYVGKVLLFKNNELYQKVIGQKQTNSYFFDLNKENIAFIKPSLVCSVEYLEKTKNNHLRQPIINN